MSVGDRRGSRGRGSGRMGGVCVHDSVCARFSVCTGVLCGCVVTHDIHTFDIHIHVCTTCTCHVTRLRITGTSSVYMCVHTHVYIFLSLRQGKL